MTQAAPPQHGGATASARPGVGGQMRVSPTVVNSYRVAKVMERLAAYVTGNSVDDFGSLCLSLSRGIDYAVVNNEKPSAAANLPTLVKQICEQKRDYTIQAFIMALLISIKNACKVEWFAEKETEELLTLTNELARIFSSPIEFNPVASPPPVLGTIMQKFYPWIKIGNIVTKLEIKPGYGVYANDFDIMKKAPCSPNDIRLLVAQVDNLDTSACIVNPQQVSFIINGTKIECRNTIRMDSGPQMPTIVTPLLKYGTNLLQAVGQFNGNYIVVIAFMSDTPLCGDPVLQDHVQPLVDGSDSDPELIEGPSRISLNCPISRSRIKLPVKGYLCKHHQCFDYNNFININSRRPSWRCPHCNQSVCYPDIRLDQDMAKVLKEVGQDVVDVIISADGSWKAIENDDQLHLACDANSKSVKETSELQESTAAGNAHPSVIDLTEDNSRMDIDSTSEMEDVKPSFPDLSAKSQSTDNVGINQNVATPIDEASWQRLHTTSGLSPPVTAWSDNPVAGGNPQLTPTTFVPSPSVAPLFDREADGPINTSLAAPEMQSHTSPNNFQSQPREFMSSFPSNEYGRFHPISRAVTRTVPAVQALPAQSPTPGTQRSRPSLNSSTPNTSNLVSQAAPLPPETGLAEMVEDLQRLIQPQALPVPSLTPARLLSVAQNRQEATYESQASHSHRPTPLAEFQNPHLQQVFNPRVSRPMGQSPSPVWPPSPLPRTPVQPGIARISPGAVVTQQQQSRISNTQRPPHLARQHSVSHPQGSSARQHPVGHPQGPSFSTTAVRLSPGPMQADPRPSSQVDLTPEQNWRPAGRMRGSLAGRDCSHFKDMMIQPTQAAQPARSPSVPVPPPSPTLPPLLNRTAPTSQPYSSGTR